MKANKLKMNAEKTHILVMSTQRRLSSLDRQLEIRIDGQVLKSTKCEKLLGCTVSCNLKWNQQILKLQQATETKNATNHNT